MTEDKKVTLNKDGLVPGKLLTLAEYKLAKKTANLAARKKEAKPQRG